jgi:hypothetical protein
MAKLNISFRFIILLLQFLTYISYSKDLSQKLTVSIFRRENAWKYLGRMHLDKGKMEINFKLKFNANP